MKEALKLALEALDLAQALLEKSSHHGKILEAFTACEQALDRKAENARELGLDYEPAPMAHIVGEIDHTGKVWKPAQPAPVQEKNQSPYPEYDKGFSEGWDRGFAAAQPEQEPVAWLHKMDNTEGLKANGKGIISITQKRKHPFGKPGVDFSKSYPVTSTPLYITPPAAQRQWVDLTPQDLNEVFKNSITGEGAVHLAIEAYKEKNT
jgi:hypothetical protein